MLKALLTIPTIVAVVGFVSVPTAVLAPTLSYAYMPELTPQTLPEPVIATSSPPIAKAAPAPQNEPVECQCVAALRVKLGINIRGNADQLVPNLPVSELHLGDVVLLRYGAYFHAAEIIGMDSEYLVHDFNYRKCAETIRFIPKDSEAIRGFYRPQ